jgi:putative phosphoesterase
MARPAEIGVISDTHGLMRPEALAALRGVSLIVHAGDIGAPAVLDALRAIAPVIAVRGNNDRDAWARVIPETAVVPAGDRRLYVVHDVKELAVDPSEYAAVIAGHSHQPRNELVGGTLFLNPGSAGPRRFRLPICVARLRVGARTIAAELITLAG